MAGDKSVGYQSFTRTKYADNYEKIKPGTGAQVNIGLASGERTANAGKANPITGLAGCIWSEEAAR